MKICHVTSAHKRYDVRIFEKEATTLAKAGYKVSIIVNDQFADEIIDDIAIVSTGFKPKTRFERLFLSKKNIKEKINAVDADIYHLHDPELLTLVNYLKKKNKTVVFDSHEDYPLTILEREWIPKFMRKIVSNIYKIYELHVVKKLDAAIVCYHWTEERYSKIINNVKLIFNFPIVNETIKSCYNSENRSISYAGGISKQWCHEDLIKSLKLCNSKIKYTLAGDINDSYGKQLQESDGWERVDFLGRISHERVYESVYGKAFAGVALLDYISQCKGKIGNLSNTKIFEIMMAGLPLICTDFQLWKNIIEEEQCGICVNPHDSKQISEAIDFLYLNPQKAKQMGENGRKAVIRKYNWTSEGNKLLKLYEKLQAKKGYEK